MSSFIDTATLATLPDSERATTPVRCYLMEYSPNGEAKPLWQFLYNPESISTDKNARYSESPVMGALPTTTYSGPDSRIVELKDLILDGWHDGKSVAPLAEGLERLTLATTQGATNGVGEPGDGFTFTPPPVLSFVMGGRTVIAPCVVTATSRRETGWGAGGEIVVARVSFTLKEISKADLVV